MKDYLQSVLRLARPEDSRLDETKQVSQILTSTLFPQGLEHRVPIENFLDFGLALSSTFG